MSNSETTIINNIINIIYKILNVSPSDEEKEKHINIFYESILITEKIITKPTSGFTLGNYCISKEKDANSQYITMNQTVINKIINKNDTKFVELIDNLNKFKNLTPDLYNKSIILYNTICLNQKLINNENNNLDKYIIT